MSDGTWMAEERSYQYKLFLENAELGVVYIVLSNNSDVSFNDFHKMYFGGSTPEEPIPREEAMLIGMQ